MDQTSPSLSPWEWYSRDHPLTFSTIQTRTCEDKSVRGEDQEAGTDDGPESGQPPIRSGDRHDWSVVQHPPHGAGKNQWGKVSSEERPNEGKRADAESPTQNWNCYNISYDYDAYERRHRGANQAEFIR